MVSVTAAATALAAFVSFHCGGELPSSANIVGTSRDGP